MNRVKGYLNVVTQGTYMGEEGTGYCFGKLESYGDFSQATRGYLQGYTQPCAFEITYPGAYVARAVDGMEYLFPPAGTAFMTECGSLSGDTGLDASMALVYGFIRVVEE